MGQENGNITNSALEELRLKNESRKMIFNLIKFIFGTFTVSVLTLVINWQIQNKRLGIENQSKENEFIGQFIDYALHKNLDHRLDFAEYFLYLSTSPDSKERWENYRIYIQHKIEQLEAKTIEKKEVEEENSPDNRQPGCCY